MAEVSQQMAEAVTRHRRGDLLGAESLYREVLRLDPAHGDALHLLGVTAHQRGDYQSAVEQIGRAISQGGATAAWHSNLGAAYRGAGQTERAIASFREAIRLNPNHADAHYNLGNVMRDQDELEDAVASYEAAVAINPGHEAAHNNLGSVLQTLGRFEDAVASFRHALEANPKYVEAEMNLGSVFEETGRHQEAVACYERAVTHDPGCAEAFARLGNTLLDQGNAQRAIACLRSSLAIDSACAEVHNDLGNAFKANGCLEEAISCYETALAIKPGLAAAHNNLGNVCKDRRHFELAAQHYMRALELDPGCVESHANLATLLEARGEMEGASRHWRRALEIKPSGLRRVRLATMLPPIYASMNDLQKWRAQLADEVTRLVDEGVTIDPGSVPIAPPFFLAYQGRNDRDLQRQINRLYRLERQSETTVPTKHEHRDGKVHVGFVSRYFKNHTIGRLMRGLIAKMSREEFHVTLLVPKAEDDEITRFLRQSADQFVELTDNLPVARQRVVDEKLDVLCYADVGMDPITYALAHCRLAPIQCTTLGHPVTTGIDVMDYFVSSDLFEPDDAAAHYSEQLVRLKSPGFYYFRPEFPPTKATRADFCLPEDKHLYACPQNLFKLHPEFDPVVAEILRRDPEGMLVLLSGLYPEWDELLKQRFLRSMPDVCDRVHFLPRLSYEDFLRLHSVVDVLLDPIHYSGGNTSYEALAFGVPIVTLPAPFVRGRLTYGLYRRMNVLDCVADSVDDYIRIALKLGTNPKFQSEVRDKIRAASDRLFEDSEVVRDWEDFFREVVTRDRYLPSPSCASSEDGVARTVQGGPNSPEALRHLAQELCRKNRFQEAVEGYAHALRLDDRCTEAYRELGQLLGVLGETEGALACYLKAIALEPAHLATRCLLGRLLEHERRFDEAVNVFEEVLQLDPNMAEAHFGLGRIFLAGQQLAESRACYERGLQIDTNHAPAWHNLGSIHHALGETEEALRYYERAVLLKPDYANAHYNLGNALSELGRFDEAIRSLQRALELDPEYAEAHNNMGGALVRCGKWDQASVSFQRASELKPDDASIHANLGRALAESGRIDEAVSSLRRAVAIDSENAVIHCTLAKMLHGQGCFEAAIASYKNSLAADESDARVHYLLGNAFKEDQKFEEAIASYQRAIEITPGFVRAHYDMGNARNRLGRLDLARESYEQVLKIDSQHCGALICLGNIHKTQDNLAQAADCYRSVLGVLPQKGVWDLWIAALCPMVFDSTAQIENYRRGLLDELIRLSAENIRLDASEIVGYACPPPYELPFHGLDDRPIKEAFASLFANCIPSEPPPVGSGRPRIGILVTEGHEGVFLRCMQGILERIRPEPFELVLVCSRNGLAKIRKKHALTALETLTISHRVDQAAEAIRAAKFDVLYYWEIGSDVTNYFLPSFRPAGVQCTAWGVPETSGISQMDYFLSSELVEIEAADDHYTEQLLRASTLLTWQERIEQPRNLAGRDKFGLAADANLYVCLQHLRKVHPDFDYLAAKILERDPRANVVLVEDRHGYAARKLRSRFERTVPNAAGRIVFVPYQPLENFRCLVAAADVILDTPHFGGGLTTYDAFSLHKPVVTLPSKFRRGRYAQACLRMMGITECIASTPGEYIDIATRLGTEADMRRAVSRKIEEASPVLFKNEQAVREYERLFSYLIEQARSR